MSSYRYIEIKPKFGLGNFSLSISKDIDKNALNDYSYKLDDPDATAFFYPWIKKKDNEYRLLFVEGTDTMSFEVVLNRLCPWLEDAHFFVYFEHFTRFTFDRLEIIEVVIKKGKLDYRSFSIKEIIPNSIFLNLNAGGVQQDFNLPFELLMSQQTLWNSDIISFLISECKSSIRISLKEVQEAEDLYFGMAFSVNYKLDVLNKLKAQLAPDLHEKIKSIQKEQRNILLNTLREKKQHNADIISLKDFQNIEEKLKIVFPLTFKKIYTEISNGNFGPGFGFLPLTNRWYSIKNMTLLFRKLLSIPEYLVPIVYLKKGVYCFLNTTNSAFPIVNFYRLKEIDYFHWYEAYEQQTYSFEEWLNNWLDEIFPEIYEINDC